MLDDSLKIELLWRAIQTESGWRNLIVSMRSAPEGFDAPKEARRLLGLLFNNDKIKYQESLAKLDQSLVQYKEAEAYS